MSMVPVISPYFFSNYWFSAFNKLGYKPEENENFNQILIQILDAYRSKDRHYHNLAHLSDMLIQVEDYIHEENPKAYCVISSFLHDYIYIPQLSNNEEASADFAVEALHNLGIKDEDIAQIKRLILLTKHSNVHLISEEYEAIFIDIDLSILASEPDRYKKYTDEIRREYAMIPTPIFNQARAHFLKSMLSKESIFHSKEFKLRDFNNLAINNLANELKFLA